MSVLLEFAMFPTGGDCHDDASVSKYVSRIINMIDRYGVTYQLTAMGTIIETETLREALDIIERSYETLEEDCERVYSSLKFDIRKGKSNRLKTKIASVEREIGREVQK